MSVHNKLECLFAGKVPQEPTLELSTLKVPPSVRLRPKKLAKDKHSSLLRALVNYGRKKFYNTGL